LLNPTASGIDLDQKMYIATELNQDNPEEMTTFFLVTLKNTDNFAALFRQQQDAVIRKEGINILNLNQGSATILGWNDEMAVLVLSNADSQTSMDNLLELFQQNPSNTVANNPTLQKALAGDHDIASWMSTDAFADHESAGFILNMIEVAPDALRGNSFHSYGDFENGKVAGRSDFFVNKSLGEQLLGRFFKNEFATSVSGNLPGEGLIFITSLALDVQGMDQFLRERPQNADYADYALQQLGLKRQDLVAALNGDLAVAGYQSNASSSKDPVLLLTAPLKNWKKGLELLDAAEKRGQLKKIEEGHYTVSSLVNNDLSVTTGGDIGQILIHADNLYYCTHPELLKKIKNNQFQPFSSTNQPGSNIFKGQILAGWIDLSRLDDNQELLKNNWLKDLQFSVHGKGAEFLLETTEPNANSINTLLKLIDKVYLERQG
jgi:hypothetical protein